MSEPTESCPACGLKTWDADDLIPGDYVCTCDDEPDDGAWSEPAGAWVETVTAFADRGLL